MPGLIGFTDQQHRYDCEMLTAMRNLLKHSERYVDEPLFFDENLYASRTHLGILQQGRQPYVLGEQLFAWCEGEFYNQSELIARYNVVADTDTALLAQLYHSTKGFHFLRDIDGYYAAVVYDKLVRQIHLITDRHGLKPFYWGMIQNNLVWSSELKGFLGHYAFQPKIDQQALREFFDIGYQLENRTWFEGVELVPLGSILTFDLSTSRIHIHPYWSWEEILPIETPVEEEDIVRELGRVFLDTVQSRVHAHERIGITLSGGLDSRAVLAAVPEEYTPLHVFTFGRKRCDEIRIARKVAARREGIHHISTLDALNWLNSKISCIWRLDASISLLHMHMSGFYDDFTSHVDIILDGFMGGPVMGGFYLKKSPDHAETYLARNRGRRFTNLGGVLGETWLAHRKPFASNKLIELAFSLPKNIRQDSYIYNKMLLRFFPKYYTDIPWQKTGYPISYPQRLIEFLQLKNYAVATFFHSFQRFGLHASTVWGYADYSAWIRQDPGRSFCEQVLLSKNALYPAYLNKKRILALLRNHMEGRSVYHDEIGLAVTFELWLQQVFKNKYRDSQGTPDSVMIPLCG